MSRFLVVLVWLLVGGALGFAVARLTDADRPGADQVPEANTAASAPATDDLETRLRTIADESARVTGTGTIRGTVRTPAGEPVRGVRVRATVQGAPEGYMAKEPLELPLNDYLAQLARYHGWARGQYREAETDAEGRYVLGDLVDQDFMLSGVLDGHEIELVDRSTLRCRPGRTVDFNAHRTVPVTLSVLMPDGKLADSASIAVSRSGVRASRKWEWKIPQISLAPGSCELTAEFGEEYRSKPKSTRIPESGDPKLVVLRLERLTKLVVRVRVPDGEDCGCVHVKCMPSSGSTLPSQVDWDSVSSSMELRPNGTTELLDLTPGGYFVGAGRSPNRIDTSAHVEMQEGPNEIELTLPPLAAEHAIVARVVDSNGMALERVGFECAWTNGTHQRSSVVKAIHQRDGSWWILLDPEEIVGDAPRGETETVELRITAEDHGARTVPVAFGKAQQISIQFGDPLQLSLVISDYAAGAVGGELHFSLEPPGSGDAERRGAGFSYSSRESGRVRVDGTAELGPIEAGVYDLVLTVVPHNGDYPDGGELQRMRMKFTSGKTEVNIPMPTLYELSVEVPEGKCGESVSLNGITPGGRFHAASTIDALQRARFSCLLAGEYIIRVEHDDGYMKVLLPGPANVIFQPSPINALRVSIVDTSKYMASVGFEDGDLIIGMDGTDFESLGQMQLLLVTARARDQAIFMILRDGAETSVKVNPKEMNASEDPGGMLVPTTR